MRLILTTASLLMIFLIFSSLSLAGTYVENFDDGDFDGWKILNVQGGVSKWEVENGILKCTRNSAWISSIVFGEEEWENYSIECDAKMIQALDPQLHAMGVDLRRMDDLSLVWCAIGDSTKWALLEVWLNGNNPAKHEDKRFDFQINRWYHLKGVANESNFEFYVDGELFVSLSDSSLPTGRVGLSAGSCVAQFDNVVITGDDVPDNAAAVSASGRLTAKWGQLRSQ